MKDIKIITPKISDKHNDSFWYDGEIAIIERNDGTEFMLIASGDIEIRNKEGILIHDRYKERNEGIDLRNDEDIGKIGFEGEGKPYFNMNNWFELVFKRKGEDCFDCVLGDVAHSYDDGIQLLKDYFNNFEVEE
jgi:hypothetical protein